MAVEVEQPAIERPERHHPRKPLIGRQAERNVERHPVPDQEQTVDQIGVPAQFFAASASGAARIAISAPEIAAIP